MFLLAGRAILSKEVSVQRKEFLVGENHAKRVPVLIPGPVLAIVEQLA
jgi:hypothetical protein